MKIFRLLPLIILVALQPACSSQGYTEKVDDLLSDDREKSEKATKRLARDSLSLSRCAAALAVKDNKVQSRFIKVLELSGDRGISPMIGHIRYVRISNAHFKLFLEFFQNRGNPGFTALIENYLSHSRELRKGFDNHYYGAQTMNHLERMKDIGSLIMALPKSRISGIAGTLFHPVPGARNLAAKILCSKNWRPELAGGLFENDSPGLGESVHGLSIIYYSALVYMEGCPPSKNALGKAAKLAGSNLDLWDSIEGQYPSPWDTRFRVLIALGNDDVIKFIEKKTKSTKNPIIFSQYLNVLGNIDLPSSEKLQKKLAKTGINEMQAD